VAINFSLSVLEPLPQMENSNSINLLSIQIKMWINKKINADTMPSNSWADAPSVSSAYVVDHAEKPRGKL